MTVVGEDLANESVVTSIEEILRLNVSAVSMSVFAGTKYENKSLSNLAKLVDECEEYGVPVMAVTAVGKELEKREARYLALVARVSAEIGARVVKTYYCKENFEKVVEGCPVPVVMAGGPKTETQKEVFDFVYDGMQKGAIGVNLGRNVWQTENPVAAIRGNKSHCPRQLYSARSLRPIQSGKSRQSLTEISFLVKKLLTAVYYNNHDVRIQETPIPQIGEEEALLKVMASGICGSDVIEWYRVPKAQLFWVMKPQASSTKSAAKLRTSKLATESLFHIMSHASMPLLPKRQPHSLPHTTHNKLLSRRLLTIHSSPKNQH